MIDILSLDVVPVDHAIQPKGVIFNVKKLGGELTQWYYQNANTWEPTRHGSGAATAPLLLKPDLALVHPDSKKKVVPEFECHWYADGQPISNTTDGVNADFVLLNNGKDLRVKKDVMPNAPVRLALLLTYYDPESNVAQNLNWDDVLTADFKADTTYSLRWVSQARQVYNPMTGGTSNRTFQLAAILGDANVSDSVKFFWKYNDANGNEQDITSHLSFVSCQVVTLANGVKVSQLVLDAKKADNLSIVCRLGNTTTAASPTEPALATGGLRWRIPKLTGRGETANGNVRRDGEKIKTYQLAVQAGGRLGMVSDAVRKANFATRWVKQENGVSSIVAYGDNPGIEVSTISSATIRPILGLLGPAEAVTGDDGGMLIADDGEIVTARS